MSPLEDYLEHFGVKGMRWGVRRKSRGRPSGGEVDDGGARKSSSSDAKKTKSLTDRAPDQLSNIQLQRINKRLELERNYARLNPTKGEVLKARLTGLLGALKTANEVYAVVNGPVGRQFKTVGQRAMGAKIPPPPRPAPLPAPRPEDRQG